MSVTLVQHKHCPSCGKAILPSRSTCEGDCEAAFVRIKRNRKWMWRGWFGATVFLVLFLVTYGPR